MNKKKKIVKKAVLIGLVVALIAVAIVYVVAMQDDAVETVVEVPVYNVFGITDESTTEQDIINVELEMNRIIISRLNLAVNFYLTTADKYYQMVDEAYAMMEAYTAATKEGHGFKYEFGYNPDTDKFFTYESGADVVTPTEVITEDYILDRLEAGQSFATNAPQIDILLVNDYSKYFELANANKLAALDTIIASDSKALKDYVPQILFDAAVINNKIYGVPTNVPVGQYQYMIFDDAYLDKYGEDAATMKSLEDLEGYLETIKLNETDVVPLQKVVAAPEQQFLFTEGFPAYVNNVGEVVPTYYNSTAPGKMADFISYYALIAKYRTLGFLPEEGQENADFAVSFFTGTIDELKAYEEETGKSFSYNVYAKPVATNDNALRSIFCVSATCNTPIPATSFIELITTDAQAKNVFLYGAEGINYITNADGTVKYVEATALNAGNTYIMENIYTGNTLLAYTYEGGNADYAKNAMNHNRDLVSSRLLGFEYTTGKIYGSNKTEDGKTVSVAEPDYIALLTEIGNELFPTYLDGTAGELDYEAFALEAKTTVEENIRAKLAKEYEANYKAELLASYKASIAADAEKMTALQTQAAAQVDAEIKTALTKALTESLTAFYKEELGEEATDEEIAAAVTAELTDERLTEEKNALYTEEKLAEMVEKKVESLISSEASTLLNEEVKSEAYAAKLAALTASAAFNADYALRIESDYEAEFEAELMDAIEKKLEDKGLEVETKINEALLALTEKYKADNGSALGLSDEDLAGKLDDYATINDCITNGLAEQYYALKGLPESMKG